MLNTLETAENILATRCGMFVVPEQGPVLQDWQKTAIACELANHGIRAKGIELLRHNGKFLKKVIRNVDTLRGDVALNAPLFHGFPEKLPALDSLEMRALFRFADEVFGMNSTTRWWPASSIPQTFTLAIRGGIEQLQRMRPEVTTWYDIKFVTQAEADLALQDWLETVLTSTQPMPEVLHKDIFSLLVSSPVTVQLERLHVREHIALVVAAWWGGRTDDLLKQAAQLTPTDLMRGWAVMAGEKPSSVSSFAWPKMTNKQRKIVYTVLNSDAAKLHVYRHREFWLSVMKGLHLQSKDIRKTYPKASALAQELYSVRKNLDSPTSLFEVARRKGDWGSAEKALRLQMGSYVRNLITLVKNGIPVSEIERTLSEKGEHVSTSLLLAASNAAKGAALGMPRLIVTKEGRGTCLPAIEVEQERLLELAGILDMEIVSRVADKLDVTVPVWVDPVLDGILVPLGVRHVPDGSMFLERGSVLPIKPGTNIRLFMHWEEKQAGMRSDLDLSALLLNHNFETIHEVSWRNLSGRGVTHSGDFTSAPYGVGSSEYIEIPTNNSMAEKLAMVVTRFSGPVFKDLEKAIAGWMYRAERSSTEKTFDPATVAGCFDIKTSGALISPIIADTSKGTILVTNIVVPAAYRHSGVHRTTSVAANSSQELTAQYQAIDAMSVYKMSVGELVKKAVLKSGGTLADRPSRQVTTFGLKPSCSYNLMQPHPFITELL